MNEEKASRIVREIVAAVCPGGPRRIEPSDALMDDLGFDSLALIELSVRLEKEFDMDPLGQAEMFEPATTVRDLEKMMADLSSENC